MADLPAGNRPPAPRPAETFLFTEIVDGTRWWEQHPDAMVAAIPRHDAILRTAVGATGGALFRLTPTTFSAGFAQAGAALCAAHQAARAFQHTDWGAAPLRVRMALHSGPAELRSDGYFGPPTFNRLARLLEVAHGGQILVSAATVDRLAGALPPGIRLRDLGECRLRDLIRFEHVYQLSADDVQTDFPPLATLDLRPNNLPAPASPLIGRDSTVGEVRTLLRRGDVRLITLTGPAGIGKTRLALQVASDLVDTFAAGVWIVPLDLVHDPARVIAAISTALGLTAPAAPAPLVALQRYLRDRRILLVLDNFEHVLETAGLVTQLLSGAPGIKVLVTSRAALRVYGEHEFPVAPLAIPDLARALPPAALATVPAVALFVDRARAAQPAFTLTAGNAPAVAAICARLDGVPLAIELAAGQLGHLTPRRLATRLDGAAGRRALDALPPRAAHPARAQTLQAAIHWSYHLLDAGEQRLFRRLAVFAGGCTLDAVEQVARDDEPPLTQDFILDGLATLIDKSLLRREDEAHGESRFSMLETIREYARERLEESGEAAAIRRRHAAYYLALVQEAAAARDRGPAEIWLARLEAEHDNLRAGRDWSREADQGATARQMAAVLGRVWEGHPAGAAARWWLAELP